MNLDKIRDIFVNYHQPDLTKVEFDEFYSFVTEHPHLTFRKRDIYGTDYHFKHPSKDIIIDLFDVYIKLRPDDRLFCDAKVKDSQRVREMITRGCMCVEITVNGRAKYWKLYQGFQKFSGITEQDDDQLASFKERQNDQRNNSKNLTDLFFSKSYEQSSDLVIMTKENGKAAHFTSFEVEGERFHICGSKNVHIVFQTSGDIQKHDNSKKDLLHCRIGYHILDLLENKLNRYKREEFLSCLSRTEFLVNFEFMMHDDQHIVDYKIEEDYLSFLSFTGRRFKNSEYGNKFGKLFPPQVAMKYMKYLGFNTAPYSFIKYSKENLKNSIDEIRSSEESEGYVIYFLQGNKTIGLWKTKTHWYIFLRAIREKIVMDFKDYNRRVQKRFHGIQNWLNCSNEVIAKWRYIAFLLEKYIRKRVKDVKAIRPVYARNVYNFFETYREPSNIFDAVRSISDGNKSMGIFQSNSGNATIRKPNFSTSSNNQRKNSKSRERKIAHDQLPKIEKNRNTNRGESFSKFHFANDEEDDDNELSRNREYSKKRVRRRVSYDGKDSRRTGMKRGRNYQVKNPRQKKRSKFKNDNQSKKTSKFHFKN